MESRILNNWSLASLLSAMYVLFGPKVCKRYSYTIVSQMVPNWQGDKRTRRREIFEFQVMGDSHHRGSPLLEKRPRVAARRKSSPEKFAGKVDLQFSSNLRACFIPLASNLRISSLN
ncbi:hypothetical protein RchiOBHm_Chr7g0182931 [Rosa chinensis]|uniref:Uncharacterized protein n=1 Tax=Rosa chinensis TaxID=74649 RepID=A0A2P6P300_ROSCH|nr:hypothetical protein RchiOBHm_Chr7g0182931 [Rosa chinensis]